jgi:hypothetical protein
LAHRRSLGDRRQQSCATAGGTPLGGQIATLGRKRGHELALKLTCATGRPRPAIERLLHFQWFNLCKGAETYLVVLAPLHFLGLVHPRGA